MKDFVQPKYLRKSSCKKCNKYLIWGFLKLSSQPDSYTYKVYEFGVQNSPFHTEMDVSSLEEVSIHYIGSLITFHNNYPNESIFTTVGFSIFPIIH